MSPVPSEKLTLPRLAEMTGRVPVVLWGKNSKFGDPAHGNAFEIHFEPVSSVSVADLSKPGLTYFPPKWTSRNLQEENLAKWAGAHARIAGISLLNRKEDVAVSDFYTKLYHLVPWLEPGSPYSGWEPAEVYRHEPAPHVDGFPFGKLIKWLVVLAALAGGVWLLARKGYVRIPWVAAETAAPAR
jgi:hypothetical protein